LRHIDRRVDNFSSGLPAPDEDVVPRGRRASGATLFRWVLMALENARNVPGEGDQIRHLCARCSAGSRWWI